MFLAPLFFLVLAWGLGGQGLRSQLLRVLGPVIRPVIAMSFTTFGLALLLASLNAHFILRTRRGILRAAGPDAVLEEVQSRVRPGASIFIYPYQPLYYYLTACNNPTRYEYLVPGHHTSAQFREAMSEVDADRTAVILFQPSFLGNIPFNTSAMPVEAVAGRDLGAEYISGNYKPCKTLNPHQVRGASFLFMVKKDLSCAGPL
jgi:hypothetical protein